MSGALGLVKIEFMKTFLAIVIGIAFLQTTFAAPPAKQNRTLRDINVISTRVLQRSISPKFYKSLLISPIQGWVVVRGSVLGTRLSGTRVIRSELGGAYDGLALKLAKEMQILGYYNVEHPNSGVPVLLHLLIYQIADGTMVLSFPTLDEAGGNQMEYWGCARLAVRKNDGTWIEIEGPKGLQGKGWAVRQRMNKLEAIFKMEMKDPHWDG